MTTIEPIELTVLTSTERAAVWIVLTDPTRLAEWFTQATEAGPAGAPYRLDFGAGSVVVGTIREHDPGRLLAYSWAWADQAPEAATLVTWTVAADPAGGTRIVLTHAGWTEAGLDEAAREDHRTYWEGYLGDLVALLDADRSSDRAHRSDLPPSR